MKKYSIIKCKSFPEVERLIHSALTLGFNEINIKRKERGRICLFEFKIRYDEPYKNYGEDMIKKYKLKQKEEKKDGN